jgi:hypothetical protein
MLCILRTLDVDRATGPDKIPAVLLDWLRSYSVGPSVCEQEFILWKTAAGVETVQY